MTTTKKDLIDRIAVQTGQDRTAVKRAVQSFLNNVILELARGNRLEFRDFGVFEIRQRAVSPEKVIAAFLRGVAPRASGPNLPRASGICRHHEAGVDPRSPAHRTAAAGSD